VVFLVGFSSPDQAFAQSVYGAGTEPSFSIEKLVRKEHSLGTYLEQVRGLRKGDIVEFKIVVTNTSDVDAEDVKIVDSLPLGLNLAEGSTTVELNELKAGESKEVTLKAIIIEDLPVNMQKCVENLAELYHEDSLQDSDTAGVCYHGPEILGAQPPELPEAGPSGNAVQSMLALVMVGLGIRLRKFTNQSSKVIGY